MTLSGDKKRQYQLDWIAKRRNAWFDSKGGKCVLCSSTVGLEVDHIIPADKKMNPTSIWSRSAAIRDAELAKCQVLCVVCHLEKTRQEQHERPGAIVHGTQKGYARKCRCQPCKTAHSKSTCEYKASKKQLG